MQNKHQKSIQNKTRQHQQQALHTKGKHAKQKTTRPNIQTQKQRQTQKQQTSHKLKQP